MANIKITDLTPITTANDNDSLVVDNGTTTNRISRANLLKIVDDLESTDTNKPLSANQGKVLNDSVFQPRISEGIDDVLTIEKSGFYVLNATNVANLPSTSYHFVLVCNSTSGTNRLLIATRGTITLKKLYIRKMLSGTWGSWTYVDLLDVA